MWVLIQRYVTANASPAERQALEEWMSKSPENKKIVQELEEIWRMTPEEDFEVDVERAWQQFSWRKQVNVSKRPMSFPDAERHGKRNSRAMVYALRAAAVILVILVAGTFSYYLSQSESNTGVVTEKPMFFQMQELLTSRAEKARVRFSDGTEVTLNSASSIRFPKKFQGSKREVYLDGEAFFKVAHDPDQPFIVHIHEAQVEVLGTEFNVRGWKEDSEMEIVVKEGKVSVNSSGSEPEDRSEVILTKGFKTELVRGRGLSPAIRVDTKHHMLWTSGGMYFDNTPLSKVFKNIERRFDVNITIQDEKMLDIPFTSTFQYAELDEILSVIAASLDIEYTRNERYVTFH